MKIFLSLFLTIIISFCSCGRGFDRGYLRDKLSNDNPVTEEEIKNALELKPQLPSPFKLAIYFTQPKTYWRSDKSSIWIAEDKDKLLEVGNELKQKGIISEAILINDSIIEGTDRKSIRLGAARAGADAVLIINGISDADRHDNIFAITYFIIITTFFVPGSDVDAIFMANASLWDVRNQFLYLSVETEGIAEETRPLFLTDRDRVTGIAKAKALTELKKDLIDRVSKIENK